MEATVQQATTCYHCGRACEETLWIGEKPFCCYGCKTVYEILADNDLCDYYHLENNPGVQRKKVSDENYGYLDEPAIRKKVIVFDSDYFATVQFFVPAVHCVSCIWLLENLQKLNDGITRSEVNFAQKHVTIDFDPSKTSLSKIASALSLVGYPPQINLDAPEKSRKKTTDKSLVLKLALAGFCFGNVMLFSFPEYLGLDRNDYDLVTIFSYLNLALAVPVLFFSALDYFTSAANSFKQKQLNIDVPIAAGLLALFLRSSFDILSGTGPGYFDSFTGLVFFLLIGRWFQSKTYESLAFDRDFTSYFPLAVNRLVEDEWKPVVIYELQRGDHILIKNMEIIPADSTLIDEEAYVDYSFVTGESRPTKVQRGDLIYAGGRLIGTPVTLVVKKQISQSHLTKLWNNEAFKKVTESKYQKIIDRAARIFTWIVIAIAIITAVYWYQHSPSEMWLVLTSVLMVACPCALALAAPFTFGSMLRVFGKNQLYLKNADVIERMAAVDAIVFDKTGTITYGGNPEITFHGHLSDDEWSMVKFITGASTHPLSKLITKSIQKTSVKKISFFKEFAGKGVQGVIESDFIKIGAASFVGTTKNVNSAKTYVYVSINEQYKGYFSVNIAMRENIGELLQRIGATCKALLSGDNDADKKDLQPLFPASTQLLFNQDPHDKLAYIQSLQQQGKKVLMVGDGLNDSGALKQADVGIAITDDTGVFTPACDGILTGNNLHLLDKYLALARKSSLILKAAFGISFFYNTIALFFAVTGHLTPLVAAILMPISSISVVSFSTIAVNIAAKKIKNTNNTLS